MRHSSPPSVAAPASPNARRPSPFRTSFGYLVAGMIWVWASDAVLYANGAQTGAGFLLAGGKGTLFFLVTTPALYWLVLRDLTDLSRANALLTAVTEGTTDAVFVKDRDGRYLLVNSAGAGLVGKSLADVLGRDDTAMFAPDSADRVQASDRRVMESGAPITVEERLTAAGVVRVFQATKAPLRDATGAVVGVVGVARDITDRVRAESELRDREQLLAVVTGAARVGLVVVGAGYEYLFANAAYAEVLGLPDGDVVGRRVPDVVPAAWEQIRPRLDRALAGEPVTYDLTVPPRPGAPGPRHYRVMYEPRSAAPGPATVVVVVIDVTEHRRAEEEARTQAEFAQVVLDAVAANVAVLDRDGNIVAVNAAWRAFAEQGNAVSGGVGVGVNYLDVCAASAAAGCRDGAEAAAAIRRVLSGAADRAALDYPCHAPTEQRWFLMNVTPLRAGRGAAVVAHTNVTALRLAEAAVRRGQELARRGEALLSAVLDALPVSVLIADEGGRLVRMNPASQAIWGPAPMSPGADEYREYEGYWPGTGRRLESREWPLARAVLNGETSVGVRVEVERFGDGARRLLDLSAAPVVGQDGVRLGGVVVCVDVTDRVRAEAALRATEERYRRLVEVLPEAVFINADDRVAYCNPACVALFGAADPTGLVGKSPLDLFAPEFHDTIRTRIRNMRATGTPAPGLDERIVRLDGRTAPVHVVAIPITDGGRPAILVCLRDLSERERTLGLLRTVLGSVSDAILTIDAGGRVESANPATERLFGYAEAELLGLNVRVLMPEPDRGRHDGYIANYLRTGAAKVIGLGREVDGRRKDGSTFPVELTVTEFQRDGERRFTGVLRDITARRKLEEQFRQAQKMEAVGRLAGGVAHDFNNLLTVINGYCDLLLFDLPPDAPHRAPVATVRDAGERAAALTAQLLAFSRKAIVAPKVFDLKNVAAQSERLLRRLIGEDIVLALVLHPAPCPVRADPNQVDQVIMNLAVNARDAMPTGGRLTLEVRPVAVAEDAPEVTETGARPGRYVELAVADTGCGMPPEVRARAFEPFFTTKGEGRGTGLGLATVFGIVHQAGGHVSVTSEIGRGTTFRVLLPEVAGATSAAEAVRLSAGRGTEVVLLVEDDAAVRQLSRLALETQGYRVLAAESGREALALFSARPGEVDVVVTDVVMPEMSGRQLADAVRAARPGTKVLFVSGYTDDAVVRYGVRDAADAFLQKPFTPLGLARKVRELLDAGPDGTSAP